MKICFGIFSFLFIFLGFIFVGTLFKKREARRTKLGQGPVGPTSPRHRLPRGDRDGHAATHRGRVGHGGWRSAARGLSEGDGSTGWLGQLGLSLVRSGGETFFNIFRRKQIVEKLIKN